MKNLKEEVLKANLYLWENDLVYGTQGNVSGLDKERNLVVIKPSGVPYGELTADMMVTVDFKGNVVEGDLKPSVDTVHHLFLYKNLKNIRGVCHTHSKFVTVFSILGIPIPVFTTAHADVFGKDIPVTKYVDNVGDHIAKAFLESYNKYGCPAVIFGNHGLFSIGKDSKEAAFHALMAEYCAQVSFLAQTAAGKMSGKEIPVLEPEEIKKWYDRYHSQKYGQKKIV